jgi:drug/metabolite transporter (DMT)-like permease
MLPVRTFVLTVLAMIAFAANSLLCRAALRNTTIDAASFTAIRLAAGAAMLWMIVTVRAASPGPAGNWTSALALFAYAAAFSFAYVSLPAATGALLLFGAVQVTMLGHGIRAGERLHGQRLIGFLLASAGLLGLLLPGLSAPPLGAALLMLGAGAAWGVYSVRGKGAEDAIRVTAGNFLRAVPIALLLALSMSRDRSLDGAGVGYAIASGALASGLGYAIWYAALPTLQSTTAAIVQLSVPLIAGLGGIVLLGEPMTLRLVLASLVVLGGIAFATASPARSMQP